MNENVDASFGYYEFAVIMVICAVIALSLCIYRINRGHKNRINVLFLIYLSCVVAQGMISWIYHALGYPLSLKAVDAISANFFTVAEFCLFNLIFSETLRTKVALKLSKIATVIFPSMSILYWWSLNRWYEFPYLLSIIEAFFIVSFCLLYFYELFIELPTRNLTNEPLFWFATGVLIYSVCMIPNFLILQYVSESQWYDYDSLAIPNYIASSTLYIFIIKSVLCKTPQVKLS